MLGAGGSMVPLAWAKASLDGTCEAIIRWNLSCRLCSKWCLIPVSISRWDRRRPARLLLHSACCSSTPLAAQLVQPPRNRDEGPPPMRNGPSGLDAKSPTSTKHCKRIGCSTTRVSSMMRRCESIAVKLAKAAILSLMHKLAVHVGFPFPANCCAPPLRDDYGCQLAPSKRTVRTTLRDRNRNTDPLCAYKGCPGWMLGNNTVKYWYNRRSVSMTVSGTD